LGETPILPAEELGEAARADIEFASKCGDGGGAGDWWRRMRGRALKIEHASTSC
jgi:hypothetical protein